MLILDAFNVLHAWRAPSSASGCRRGVPQLLAALAEGRYAGHEITIVCDGDAGIHAPQDQAMVTRLLSGSRVRRVLYAGPHREADDLIEDLLRENPDPRRLIIVSSDRRLRAAAAKADAAIITTRAFLADLEADQAKALARQRAGDHGVASADVRAWLAYFNIDPTGTPTPTPPTAPPTAHQRSTSPTHNATQPAAPHASRASAKKHRPDDAGYLHVAPADDLAAIDPRDLDMERWLREGPAGRSPHGA